MTLAVKHLKVTAKGDGTDPTLVQPSDWNASHTISCANGTVVGNNSGADGAASDIPFATLATAMGCLTTAGNLAGLASQATSRTNLGLRIGTIAVFIQSADPAGSAVDNDLWGW